MSLTLVRWIEFRHATDHRGVLTAIEGGNDVPFEIKRVFYMHGTPNGVRRGGHAHQRTQQVVIPVSGWFLMDLSDGKSTQRYELANPNRGLYVPAMIWIRLYDFSPSAVALVLADTHYDIVQSLRTWEEFLAATQKERR